MNPAWSKALHIALEYHRNTGLKARVYGDLNAQGRWTYKVDILHHWMKPDLG